MLTLSPRRKEAPHVMDFAGSTEFP